jgi:excisionase family DNA binding protein
MLQLLRLLLRGSDATAELTTLYAHEPQEAEAALAREALARVRHVLDEHPGGDDPLQLTLEDNGEVVTMPRVAVDLLVRVLANLAAGQGVTLVPAHAELSTQQAADLLNVSRPYLIKLLDERQIDYRTVGTHRRIKASSLMDYKRHDDARRRAAADELASMTQEMGFD